MPAGTGMTGQIKPPERNGAYCRARFARGRKYRVCLQGRRYRRDARAGKKRQPAGSP